MTPSQRASLWRGLLAAPLVLSACASAEACDYCLLSQGISPLDTIDGRGLRLVQRYTELDRVYAGSRELDNPGARETYHTTELSGFWSARPWLTVMAVLPFRVTAVDGHLEHHGGHHHADADDHEDHDHHDEESVVDPAVRAVEDQHSAAVVEHQHVIVVEHRDTARRGNALAEHRRLFDAAPELR